jgi:hypothetical protein
MVLRRLVVLAAVGIVLGACGGGAERDQADATATTTLATTTVPTTTAARASYRFRGMTITMPAKWKVADERGDEVEIRNGRACARVKLTGAKVCPGFSLLGPKGIATANEQSPYRPEQPYHPGTDVGPCLTDPDFAWEGPSRLAARRFVKVGGHTAIYREWRYRCYLDRSHPAPNRPLRLSYTQRIWYLPKSKILVLDEWSTPGLREALAAANWR